MWTVATLAQDAGVSTSAVRARLSDGAILGQRVLHGRREVWEIDDDSALRYIAAHDSAEPSSAAGAPATAAESGPVPASILSSAPSAAKVAPRTSPPGLSIPVGHLAMSPWPGGVERRQTPGAAAVVPASGPEMRHAVPPDVDAFALQALRSENAQLRAALGALTRAHRALVELVEIQAAAAVG
jgi:hypothetical protein